MSTEHKPHSSFALPRYGCNHCGVFVWSPPVPHRNSSCDPDSYEEGRFDGFVEQYEVVTRKLAREQARKRHYKDELEIAQARITDQESSERVLLEQLEALVEAVQQFHKTGNANDWHKVMFLAALEVSSPAREPEDDISDITEAFKEVIGYLHAYRSGAPAGPEVGWAIRNFNEVVERHVALSDSDPAMSRWTQEELDALKVQAADRAERFGWRDSNQESRGDG